MIRRGIIVLAGVLLTWLIWSSTSLIVFALPVNRAYEMVSPVYKGGYGVSTVHSAAPDGESVVFVSLGGFSGVLTASGEGANEYFSHRQSSGWSTVSIQPPFGSWVDVSRNLEFALANGPLGPNAGFENYASKEDVLLEHRTDAPELAEEWQTFGNMILKRLDGGTLLPIEEGASADLCHVVIGKAEGPLLSEAIGTNEQIYDVAACDGSSINLIGLDNSGTVINLSCAVELGIGTGYANIGSEKKEQDVNFNAVAADGSQIFFTTNVQETGNCGVGTHQLFVRLGDKRTLEISKPLIKCSEVPCAGASERASAFFKGASEDGKRVFFTTNDPLVETDKDSGNDLYMATIGCPDTSENCAPASREVTKLQQISTAANPNEVSDVQGVSKVAADGSRVYFVARGVLVGANAEGRTPITGADNLYMYEDRQNRIKFIADICSGSDRSGAVEYASCPQSSGGTGEATDLALIGDFPEAQTAGQGGKYLVFSTYGRLLSDDTDNAKDIYRYDAETGTLTRISIGEEGYDANGNGSESDATIGLGHMGGSAKVFVQYEGGTRAISEDGTQIVFSTTAPISPNATNGLSNVYEWHNGVVSLISLGSAEASDGSAAISASGHNILFTTTAGLVPQDNDGAQDIYDARVEGGFPQPGTSREPCVDDSCQGSLAAPVPLLIPGSTSQVPGENFSKQNKAKPKRARKHKKKKIVVHRGVRHVSKRRLTPGRGSKMVERKGK
jgi:hypothetical protein